MRARNKADIVRFGRQIDCVGHRLALDEKSKNAVAVPPGQQPGSFNVACGALISTRSLVSECVFTNVVPRVRVT